MKRVFWFAVLASASVFTETLSANTITTSVNGTLTEGSCSGGGIVITETSVTWLPAVNGGTAGCAITGAGTNLAWSGGGSLGPGITGSILNLSSGLAVSDFMVFGLLDFVLTGLGPGSTNTNCANLMPGQMCSVAVGSPFVLEEDGTGGTAVSMLAAGTVADPVSLAVSSWSGTFSTDISGLMPGTVQSTLLGGGTITSSPALSGSGTSSPAGTANTNPVTGIFTVVATPEPGTAALLVIGAVLLAACFRDRRRLNGSVQSTGARRN